MENKGELEEKMWMELEGFHSKSARTDKDPLEILTTESWQRVLWNLEEPEDFKKFAKACRLFKDIIENEGEEWVPQLHVVLGLVMPFLGKKELFSLRRVSPRTNRLVRNFLDNNGFRKFYTDGTFTTTEELKFSLNSKNFGSDGQVTREIEQRWGPEVNAFPSRALHIDTRQPLAFRAIENGAFGKRILELFDRPEIQNILHIKLTFTETEFSSSQFIKTFVKKVVTHLKSIRTMSLDFQGTGGTAAHQDYWKTALPVLQHSLPFKLEFGPQFARNDPIRIKMSRSYAPNLKEGWMDLLKWRAEFNNCPFMKKLELFNAQRLSLENYLDRLNAPELEELRVNYAPESLKTETKHRWNALEFQRLKKMLKPFPKLKVLRFEGVDQRLRLGSYSWDFKTYEHKFLPTAYKEKERIGKLSRFKQIREIWKLIPNSIELISFNGDKGEGWNRKVCLKFAAEDDYSEWHRRTFGVCHSKAQRKQTRKEEMRREEWRRMRKEAEDARKK